METYEKVFDGYDKHCDLWIPYDIKNKTTGRYVGRLEEHVRYTMDTENHYYVGWHFESYWVPGTSRPAIIKAFNSEEDAMSFITDGFTK